MKKPILIVTMLGGLFLLVVGYLIYQNYQLQKQIQQKLAELNRYPSSAPSVSVSPSVATTSWLTYKSDCGFSLRYPKDWIFDRKNYCGTLYADNYNKQEDTGLYVRVIRTQKGTKIPLYADGAQPTMIVLNSVGDLIRSSSSAVEAMSDVTDKTYDSLKGKFYIETYQFMSFKMANFAFESGNYIYVFQYPADSVGGYSKEIGGIISSIRFE